MQKTGIKINQERLKLSTIKRYWPTMLTKSSNNKYVASLSIKMSVNKNSDTYVYNFESKNEYNRVVSELDKYFGIE